MLARTFSSDVCNPQTTTPPRGVHSVRRTSNIDIAFGDNGALILSGGCRDLRTAGKAVQTLGVAQLAADLDQSHMLLRLQIPAATGVDIARVEGLVGSLVGAGFRGRVAAALLAAETTPLFVLLDDLPVAALISGYARMYRGEFADQGIDRGLVKADICSGWRSDGHMVMSIRRHGQMPIPLGPAAPELLADNDPLGWHEIRGLSAGSMRRRRLINVSRAESDSSDVDGSGQLEVFAMFRDTHVDANDGIERVLHEYSLTAVIDRRDFTLQACVATPRVLPWNECPDAANSAARLNGQPISELRELVRRDFRGLGTCTHLNDLLRSLGDLSGLAALLDP